MNRREFFQTFNPFHQQPSQSGAAVEMSPEMTSETSSDASANSSAADFRSLAPETRDRVFLLAMARGIDPANENPERLLALLGEEKTGALSSASR